MSEDPSSTPPSAIPVDAGTRLSVTYSFHPSMDPSLSDKIVVVHHGILHTREHFLDFIKALNAEGLHVAMIDQQSQYAPYRERIGLGCYATGMAAACRQIEEEQGKSIGGFVYHSMGAAIGEKMQARRENEELRSPTVFMTPIPVLGSWPIFLRFLVSRPLDLFQAISKKSVLSLADREADVKKLFLDGEATEGVVKECRNHLMHSPFYAFLQLTFRFLGFFLFRHNQQRNMLVTSDTDHIFASWEYCLTRWRYRLRKKRDDGREWLNVKKMRGGHDIFLAHPKETAVLVASFLCDAWGIPKPSNVARFDKPHSGPPNGPPNSGYPIPRGPTRPSLQDAVSPFKDKTRES